MSRPWPKLFVAIRTARPPAGVTWQVGELYLQRLLGITATSEDEHIAAHFAHTQLNSVVVCFDGQLRVCRTQRCRERSLVSHFFDDRPQHALPIGPIPTVRLISLRESCG